VAKLVRLPHLRDGISIEIMLLISPTFSGIVEKAPSSLMKAVCDVFPDASDEDRERLEQALQSARGSLDIAAIGPHQRDSIRSVPIDPEPVRIAMLHHHLLPHPEVEAGPFESVLDAGPVIEELLPRFDLALTGHKHTRRLMQLRKGNEFLDVYTGPSLFYGHDRSRSGFTIIDVHGSNGAYYATLQYWNSGERVAQQTESLIRRGRVDPKLVDICAQVTPELQQSKLVPLLTKATRGLQWSDGHRAHALCERFWTSISHDLEALSEKAVIFRPPNLSAHWGDLLELAAQKKNSTLRLVSETDLRFWLDAAREMSDAWYYERHVREFDGKKSRVLVLDRRDVRNEREALLRVVESMSYLDVFLVMKDSVPHNVPKDFGIIGDLAVSSFQNTDLTGRSLKEDFSDDARNNAELHWKTLMGAVRWQSGQGRLADRLDLL
jgi:hypothetical protein